MDFTPPQYTRRSSTTSTTTSSSILSFRDFFGGGTITGQIRTVTSQSQLQAFVPSNTTSFISPGGTLSYRIKWTDFGTQLSSNFADLYGNMHSGDVSIMCGQNQELLRAHQFVLSTGSLYFRDALKV